MDILAKVYQKPWSIKVDPVSKELFGQLCLIGAPSSVGWSGTQSALSATDSNVVVSSFKSENKYNFFEKFHFIGSVNSQTKSAH